MSGEDALRTLLLWCPDWPVVAAEITEGVAAGGPVAVLRSNRVIACSEAARVEGVRRGLRKREAESRCPGLTVVEWDEGRDARAFEPVVAAVEEKAAGVEVLRPGAVALAARGPARYFGGEERAAEVIVEHVAASCEVEAQAGIADGTFAAGLAARRGVIVPPGGTPEFLAGVGVEALDRPQLADMLRRLGIRTLGAFAALPAADVLARFGFDASLAHRLAAGRDHRPLAVRLPPPGLEVTDTYEEPLDRVDVAAFAGRALAEHLHDRLAAHGLACTRLGISAVTEHGAELHRVWRHDGLLTTAAIAERVRWQLDGWLTGTNRRPATGLRPAPPRPTSGIIRLTLTPEGILAHAGLQPGLWGETGEERRRAHRALSRVQGILGPDSVVTPVLAGGRSPSDAVTLIPWGDERTPARPGPLSPGPAPAPARRRARKPPPQPIPASLLPPATPQPPPPGRATSAPPASAESPAPVAARNADPGAFREPETASAHGLADVLPLRRKPSATPDGEDRSGTGRAVVSAAAPVGRIAPAGAGSGGGGLVGVMPGGAASMGVTSAGIASPGVAADRVGPGGAAGERGSGRGKGALRGRVRSARPGWPGSLPAPAPALVPARPGPARVFDVTGEPVRVSGRLELSGDPAVLAVEGQAPVGIVGWAGPWPVDERWWAPAEAHRRVRFQVALDGGTALLLALAGGRWFVEARYD